MFRLASTAVILLAIPGISVGQTRDQCAMLAKGVLPVISTFSQLDSVVKETKWDPVVIITTGQVRTAAEAAERAQAALGSAVHTYLAAMQDFTYQLQICAR